MAEETQLFKTNNDHNGRDELRKLLRLWIEKGWLNGKDATLSFRGYRGQ